MAKSYELQFFSLDVLLVFQMSEVLVEMGSNLMQVDDQILSQAQKEKRACSSIVCSLETLAWPQLHPNSQDLSMVGDTLGLWHSGILPECIAVWP